MKMIAKGAMPGATHLLLLRSYHSTGVNGSLYLNDELICYTIELPWLDNRPRVSCIPEGCYRLKQRWSPRFKLHLHVQDVPGRSLILMHAANDALKELKGCIAPVSSIAGVGRGLQSRIALKKLLEAISKAGKEGPVLISIKSKKAEDGGRS